MNKLIDIKDILNQKINLELLDPDMKIATMTITCKFDTLMIIPNIERYVKLERKAIVTVITKDIVRTIVDYKQKKEKAKKKKNIEDMTNKEINLNNKRERIELKKKKKNNKSFDNQISLIVEMPPNRFINVKLFKNGSVQMTGCKHVYDILYAIDTLCKSMTTSRFVYNKQTKILREIWFVTAPQNISRYKVQDFQIWLINSTFYVDFLIDRKSLYDVLVSNKINCIFEPCIHACVNIKFEYKTHVISIFVFESGSIIITGAKKIKHTKKAYGFIIKILYQNYDRIVKYNIDEFLKNHRHLYEKYIG